MPHRLWRGLMIVLWAIAAYLAVGIGCICLIGLLTGGCVKEAIKLDATSKIPPEAVKVEVDASPTIPPEAVKIVVEPGAFAFDLDAPVSATTAPLPEGSFDRLWYMVGGLGVLAIILWRAPPPQYLWRRIASWWRQR